MIAAHTQSTKYNIIQYTNKQTGLLLSEMMVFSGRYVFVATKTGHKWPLFLVLSLWSLKKKFFYVQMKFFAQNHCHKGISILKSFSPVQNEFFRALSLLRKLEVVDHVHPSRLQVSHKYEKDMELMGWVWQAMGGVKMVRGLYANSAICDIAIRHFFIGPVENTGKLQEKNKWW